MREYLKRRLKVCRKKQQIVTFVFQSFLSLCCCHLDIEWNELNRRMSTHELRVIFCLFIEKLWEDYRGGAWWDLNRRVLRMSLCIAVKRFWETVPRKASRMVSCANRLPTLRARLFHWWSLLLVLPMKSTEACIKLQRTFWKCYSISFFQRLRIDLIGQKTQKADDEYKEVARRHRICFWR